MSDMNACVAEMLKLLIKVQNVYVGSYHPSDKQPFFSESLVLFRPRMKPLDTTHTKIFKLSQVVTYDSICYKYHHHTSVFPFFLIISILTSRNKGTKFYFSLIEVPSRVYIFVPLLCIFKL